MKNKKFFAILLAAIMLTIISAFILPAANINATAGINSISALSDSSVTDFAKVTFTCPMHPEVTSDKPGTCPKCGMDMIIKEKEKKDEGMNSCPDMEKCKQMGCNINDCKAHSGGCMNECPMMKEHMDHDKSKEHDHNSNDNDDKSGGHKHKSGRKKGC